MKLGRRTARPVLTPGSARVELFEQRVGDRARGVRVLPGDQSSIDLGVGLPVVGLAVLAAETLQLVFEQEGHGVDAVDGGFLVS